MTDAAFYCVADERYFLGAVAMINSLRLVGHRRAGAPARSAGSTTRSARRSQPRSS